MENMHYIGLDIHKKIIAFCIKTKSVEQNRFAAAWAIASINQIISVSYR